MGWVKDKGKDAVQKFDDGGEVKPKASGKTPWNMTKEERKANSARIKAQKAKEKYEKENPILSGKKTLKEVTDEGIAAAKKRTEEGIKKQKRIQSDIEEHIGDTTGRYKDFYTGMKTGNIMEKHSRDPKLYDKLSRSMKKTYKEQEAKLSQKKKKK